MKKIYCSVVVPAHNEAENLKRLVLELKSVLSKIRKKYEIIISNDNSTDNSLEVLKKLKKIAPELVIINRTKNPGVGYAIRDGLNKVRGEIIISMDADLSHNPAEIPKFLKALKGWDMVCGSRYFKGGKAEMSYSRIFISRLFNFIFRNIIGVPVKDFTSGFRVYKAKIIKNIRLTSKKFGIFIEIPLKAYNAGFRMTEIPISYSRRTFGRSNLAYLKQGPEYLKVVVEAIISRFTK